MPVSQRSFRTNGQEFVFCLFAPTSIPDIRQRQEKKPKRRPKESEALSQRKCPAKLNAIFLVAIVVVVTFLYQPLSLAVVFVPATLVAIVVMVPVMVVLDAPVVYCWRFTRSERLMSGLFVASKNMRTINRIRFRIYKGMLCRSG